MSDKDKRIVELEFDNKSFESGVAKSLKTLEQLKDSLNFDGSAKGLDGLQNSINSVDFSKMADGIESLQNRFSTLGIAGMTVIQDITKGVMNAGKSLVNSTIGQIMSGGQKRSLNMEHAKFMWQGLNMPVEAAMKNANDAVTDTAYGLDEAAVAVATLGASGIKLGDEMAEVLKGIAGVASMTQSDFSSISDIFSKIASNGVVMTEEARQFSSKGLNVTAELAHHLHTTEDQIYEMYSKKQISAQTFFEAMAKAYGDQAKKANETWSGALSNLKAALSRIGEPFYNSFYGHGRQAILDLKALISGFKSDGFLNPFSDWFDWKMEVNAKRFSRLIHSIMDPLYEDTKDRKIDGRIFDFDPAKAEAFKKVMDGLKLAVDVVYSAIRGLFSFMTPLGTAFSRIFQFSADGFLNAAKSVDHFVRLIANGIHQYNKNSQAVKGLAERYQGIARTVDNLKRIFQGVFAAFDIAFRIIGSVGSAIWSVIGGPITSLIDLVLSFGAVIGDALVAFDDFLKGTDILPWIMQKLAYPFKLLGDYVGGLIGKLRDLVTGLKIDGVEDLINRVKAGMADIDATLDRIKEKIVTVIGEAKEKIQSLFQTMSNGRKEHENTFNAFEKIGDVFEKVGHVLSTVWTKVKNIFSSIKLEDLFKLGSAVGIAGIVKIVKEIVSSFKTLQDSLKSIPDSVRNLISGLTEHLKALTEEVKSRKIKNIAEAVLMLGIACMMLGTVDQEKLIPILSGVTAILGEMMGLLFIINKFMSADPVEASDTLVGSIKNFIKGLGDALIKNVNMLSLSLALIGVASAVGILAEAIATLAGLNWEDIGRGVSVITVLMAELVGLMAVMNKFSFGPKMGKNLKQAGFGMIEIAAAMLIFSFAAERFAKMNWADIGKAVATMAGILAEVAAFSKFSKGGNLMMAAGGMIILGFALAEFVGVLELFRIIDWGSVLEGLGKISAVLLTITLFSRFVKGGNLLKASAMLMAFALALAVLEGVLKLYTLIGWDSILDGLGKMSLVLAAITLFSRFSDGGNLLKASVGLMGMGVAVGILGAALLIFNRVNMESIAKAVDAVGMLLLLIEAFILVTENIGRMSTAKVYANMDVLTGSLLKFGAAILAISLAFLVFSAVPVGGIIKSLLTIAAVLAILGGAAALLDPLIPSMERLIGVLRKFAASVALIGLGLLAGALAIAVFLEVLERLSGSMEESIARIAHAIALLIIDLVAELANMIPQLAEQLFSCVVQLLDQLIQYTPQIVDRVVNFIILVFNELTPRIPELITAASEFLSTLFGAILDAIKGHEEAFVTAVMSIISAVLLFQNISFTGVLKSIAVIGILFAALTALISGLGALMQIQGFEQILRDGGTALMLVGEAIGKFFGGIVGGFLEGASDTLPAVGTNLSAFATNAQAFFDMVSKLDPNVLSGTESLANAVLALSATGFLEGIKKFLGMETDFAEFGHKLSEFADGLVEFAGKTSGIDETAVQNIKNAADASKALADFARVVPNTGGLLGKIVGENDIDDFGHKLASYGKSLLSFSNSVSGIDETAVTNIKNAADASKALADFARVVPNTGGLLGKIVGENDLDDFGRQLRTYGRCLSTFASSVSKISNSDIDAIKKAAEASKGLADMATAIPNSGGLFSDLFGDNDIDDFGVKLQSFGISLVVFASILDKMPENATTKISLATQAATGLVTLANQIPPGSSWIENVFGGASNQKMDEFGTQLSGFGSALVGFYDSIKGLDADAITKIGEVAAVAQEVVKIASIVPDVGGVSDLWSGSNSLSAFGEGLADFGQSLVDFGSAVQGFTTDMTKGIKEASIASGYMNTVISNLGDFKTGGAKEWIFGKNDTGSLADNLASFGDAIMSFAGSVEGITSNDTSNISIAVNASENFKTLATNLSAFSTGGIKQWWSGKTDFEAISTGLTTYLNTIIDFGNSAHNITSATIDGIQKVLLATDKLKELSEKVPSSGGFLDFFTGESGKLSNFAENIKAYGEGLKSFCDSISGISITDAQAQSIEKVMGLLSSMDSFDASSASGFSSSLGKVGDSGVDSFVDSFKGVGDKVAPIINNAMDDVVSKIGSYSTQFSTKAEELIKAFSTGLSNTSSVIFAINGLALSAIVNLRSHSGGFFSAGCDCVQGFINGMLVKSGSVYTVAYNLGLTALNAAKSAVKSNSPSKEFYKLGVYNGEGLINGTNAMKAKVATTYTELGNVTLNSIGSAINRITDYINNGVDSDPVIRPVLDLSNVDDGIGMLNSIFNDGYMRVGTTGKFARAIDYNSDVEQPEKTIQNNTYNNYTQNISSPKPVSRYDVYRNTKNLLNLKREARA